MVSASNSSSSGSSLVKVFTESLLVLQKDFLLSVINWNFSGFVFMELVLNQYKILLASCFRFSNTVFKFAPQEYKVLSSAKSQISDYSMTKNKLFINIFYRLWIYWTHRRSPLVKVGLEIPCKLSVSMLGTCLNLLLLERYEQLIEELYIEPKKKEFLIISYTRTRTRKAKYKE